MISLHRCVIATVSIVCTWGAVDALVPNASGAANVTGSTHSATLSTCTVSDVSQPFAPWFDFADYELTPGGDFETPTWTLTGAAQRVAGSEPHAATGTLGSFSLSLPASASAQSPPMCVGATSPSIRLFIAGTGSVAVDIVEGGSVIPAGVVVAGGDWAPTPVIPTSSPALAAVSNGAAQVSVMLAGVSGSPRVDDVFMDPWSRG